MLHGAIPADASALSLVGAFNNPSQGTLSAVSGAWGDLDNGPDQVTVSTTGEKLAVLFHVTAKELGSPGPSDMCGIRLACFNGTSTTIPNDANNTGGLIRNLYNVQGDTAFWSAGHTIEQGSTAYNGLNEAIGSPIILDGLGTGTWTIKLEYAFNVNGGSYSGLTVKRRRLFVWRWGF